MRATPLAMAFALSHLFAVLTLFLLFGVSGSLLEELARAPRSEALGATLSRVTLGSIAWILLLFLLASVGLYRSAVVVPLGGALLCFALYRRMRASPFGVLNARDAFIWLRARARGAGPVALVALPAAVVLLAAFFQALSPHIGWDDNVYHLTLPKRYLGYGGFRRIPFSVYSHWPHAIELLYGLALMLSDQIAAKLVHTAFLALTLAAVYRLSRRECSRSMAMLATLLVLGNEVLLFEAPIAYIDIGFAFYFLAAAACADEYLRSRRVSVLVLSGACAGAVAASKLSGFVAVLCVGACVLVGVRLRRDRWLEIALALLVPAALLAVPWYVKTWIYTGNPVYPFQYARFGGIEWSARLGRAFYEWQQSMGMGRTLHDYLLLPLRVVLEGQRGYDRFDGSFGKFWLCAVPLALLGSLVVRGARVYSACACMYFAFWALSSQQARFLLAVLPLFAVAAATAADAAIKVLPFAPARVLVRVALAAGIVITALPALQPFCKDGLAAARSYFELGPEAPSAAVPEGYAFVNQKLPRDAKLMLVNINRGFFLDREYICDSFFEASQIHWTIMKAASAPALDAVLRQLGITHIYVDHANWGIPYPPYWSQFLFDRHWTKREYRCRDRSCTIYKLRHPSQAVEPHPASP